MGASPARGRDGYNRLTMNHSAARRVLALGFMAVCLSACAGGKKSRPKRPTSQEQYDRAMALMEDHKYASAREALGGIGVRELQDSDLDPLVKLALADAYWLDGGITNVIEAQARYEQFLNFYPTHPKVAYAQFQVGQCLYAQSSAPANDLIDTRRALEEYKKVKGLDTTGEYTDQAEAMADKCREKLARHEYDVGRFYMRRKDCTAASGRFRTVLEEYPKFTLTDGATYYLARALTCANNTAEGRIYYEKLEAEFPDSEFASRARRETSAGKERTDRGAPPAAG